MCQALEKVHKLWSALTELTQHTDYARIQKLLKDEHGQEHGLRQYTGVNLAIH